MITTIILWSILSFPSLSLAIGQVESGMNTKAKGKAGEQGAFQVISSHWGKVPKDIIGQMKQHNKVLTDLTQEHLELELAVERYNGKGKDAREYKKKVRKKALEIELLEW